MARRDAGLNLAHGRHHMEADTGDGVRVVGVGTEYVAQRLLVES